MARVWHFGRGVLAIHLVARLRSNRIDLRQADTAPLVWAALRRRFPQALIVKLMPDHPHLITLGTDPEAERRELANVCGRIQLGLRWPRGAWEPIPAPRVITKRKELRRQFRYVALNECRAGLARDPLEALWSTYREMFDAVIEPWVDTVTALRLLGAPRRRSLSWLHEYCSGDPTASTGGTPLPQPTSYCRIPTLPLGDVIRATAAAMRAEPSCIYHCAPARRTFVGLARAVGWRQPAVLAEACEITPGAIRRLAKQADPRLLMRTPALRHEKRSGSRR